MSIQQARPYRGTSLRNTVHTSLQREVHIPSFLPKHDSHKSLVSMTKKNRFKLAHLNTPEESLPQNRFGGVMENTAYMSGASERGLRPGCAGEPEAP